MYTCTYTEKTGESRDEAKGVSNAGRNRGVPLQLYLISATDYLPSGDSFGRVDDFRSPCRISMSTLSLLLLLVQARMITITITSTSNSDTTPPMHAAIMMMVVIVNCPSA